MKFHFVLFLFALILVMFSACNSAESKAKKMFRRQKVLLEMQQKAAKDSVLSDGEIEKMVQAYRENLRFNNKLIRNHRKDSAYMNTYLDELNQLSSPYKEEVRESNERIRNCNGFDRFRIQLMKLYDTNK